MSNGYYTLTTDQRGSSVLGWVSNPVLTTTGADAIISIVFGIVAIGAVIFAGYKARNMAKSA